MASGTKHEYNVQGSPLPPPGRTDREVTFHLRLLMCWKQLAQTGPLRHAERANKLRLKREMRAVKLARTQAARHHSMRLMKVSLLGELALQLSFAMLVWGTSLSEGLRRSPKGRGSSSAPRPQNLHVLVGGDERLQLAVGGPLCEAHPAEGRAARGD